MDGSQWLPLQLATSPTPLFPDSVSGRSAYSAAAAARILELWTRSDNFAQLVMLAASSSKIEPGITPNHPITLQWDTFTEAADEAASRGATETSTSARPISPDACWDVE